MKAAVLVEQNRPLQVTEVTLPQELAYGQVLVRVHYSTICGSQLGEIDGVKGSDGFLPHLLGHEGSGVVESVGPGVTRVRPGQHAVLHWMKAAGVEASTPTYGWNGQAVNAGCITTFNEWAVVSENRLTPVPDNLELDLAPLFGCAVTTGIGVLMNDAQLKIGESVLVFGAGGVGLNVIQGAALAGAHPIIAVDVYDEKLSLAAKLGATHVINARTADVRASLGSLLGCGADVAIETTGVVDVIELAYSLSAPRGRTVLVGVPRADAPISIASMPLHFGKVLTGSHGGSTRPDHDIPRYVALHQAGKLTLRELIAKTVALEAINEGIEEMRHGCFPGRCLIDMSPTPAVVRQA